ncbi:MAG: NAD-dependent epimerase/dehydratase family protein [Bacteroidales bacterium]
MKILITGATGFIGAHLLVKLFREGKKIRATYRNARNFEELKMIAAYHGIKFGELFSAVEWVKVDLLDAVALDRAMWDISEVYHCAAVVSFHSGSAETLLRTNVEGTRNIVKACLRKEIGKLCYISSIGALNGTNGEGFTDEDCFEEPAGGSVYSRSKHLSEKEVWDGIEQGLQAVILNPGIVLGYGDLRKGSLQFFDSVRNGLLFYTAGVTGYVDVRDVCRAAFECMEANRFNRRFLLVSENLSYQQLLILIARAYGKRAPFIKASKPLLNAALFFSSLKTRITGKPQRFTRETLRSSVKKTYYLCENTRAELGFEFIPIAETVQDIVAH